MIAILRSVFKMQPMRYVALAWLALGPGAMLAQRESVVIGAGDTIHVHVFDTPEMDQQALVDDNGNAPLLFVGAVMIGGKTPLEAADVVKKAMVAKNLMQHPQVAVTIEKSGAMDVAVGGEVNHPGAFMITTARPVLDLIAMAGGLTMLADRHIVIERRGAAGLGEKYFVSNEAPVAGVKELKVWPGDRILVPKAGVVYVLGDVGKPGGFVLNSNDEALTLLQVLALAESPNKTALYGRIKLLRRNGLDYTLVPLNVNDIKAGKAPDVMLQANDVVMVPFSYVKNFAINSTSVVNSLGSAAIYTHF